MFFRYSFSPILQTTTLWLVNVDRADSLIQGLVETGRFPIQFYRGWLRGILTIVVPVAFMTTFPAQRFLADLS